MKNLKSKIVMLDKEGTSQKPKHLTRVISVTSGKGGVGKTNLVVNLSISLANLGHRVLILDADLGLANIDVLLGLETKYTLNNLFSGEKTLEEIIVDGPVGISIIPAASGIDTLRYLNANERLLLMDAIEQVAYPYDYLLIDTGAGIGGDVMYFNSASTEVVCVINNEPTSITDAYALIKVLSNKYGERSVSILVNNVESEKSAKQAYTQLARVAGRYLQTELRYLGFIPTDYNIKRAVCEQKAVSQIYPSSPASLAISGIARNIDEDFWKFRVKGGMQFFFKQLLEIGLHGN